MRSYLSWANWCLNHRLLTSLFAIVFFVVSIMLIPLLPKGFVPAPDRGQTQITLELPPGSSLEETLCCGRGSPQDYYPGAGCA